jgi:hypothetical protein
MLREQRELQGVKDELHRRIRTLIANPYTIPSESTIKRLAEQNDVLRKRVDGISSLGRLGAARILAFRKKIDLVGIESDSIWDTIGKAKKQGDEQKQLEFLFERRDSQLMQMALALPDKIQYTDRGCEHDSEKMIHASNQNRSDMPFSFVELTPFSVVEWEKMQRKKHAEEMVSSCRCPNVRAQRFKLHRHPACFPAWQP